MFVSCYHAVVSAVACPIIKPSQEGAAGDLAGIGGRLVLPRVML